MTAETSGTVVRMGRPEDVGAVVALHLESFPGFFLTFLGPAFLEILYSEILGSAEGVLLIAEQDGALTGFVAGVTRQIGFYGRLVRKRKWSFARASMGALLRRPRIAGRLVRALGKREEAARSSAEACLMSLGVSPRSAGRGTGSALVRAFSEEIRGRGVDRFCLTTDRLDNDAVNAFYRKLGFELARTYTTPEGRQMNEYVMSLERSEG